MGEIEISHLLGSEQGISRPQRLIHPSDADIFVAMIQLSGRIGYEHSGQDASGLDNSITLFDLTKNYQTMMKDRLDIINVTLSRKHLEALFGSPRNLAGLSLGPDDPATSLVIEFFRKQLDIADHLDADSARRLGNVGADLLATAFLEKMGRTPQQPTAATAAMVRAKAYIRDHLGDHTLTPESVAASQTLSLRRMQELFAAESLAIGDYIWEQRLLRAHSMLRSRALTHISVAEVAYAVGFVSPPHFSRRFRARFGYTAIEARRLIGE